jgi:toxin ParE1/3/4
MFQINITEPAERDMSDCARYITVELRNKVAATRLLDEAEDSIYSLEDMPFRCALVKDETLAQQGIRCLPIHNYLLFYIVREETKTVTIERFLYRRRDWTNILKSSL